MQKQAPLLVFAFERTLCDDAGRPLRRRHVDALMTIHNPIAAVVTESVTIHRHDVRLWIDEHFPLLAGVPILKRAEDDEQPAAVSKIARITEFRRQYPGRPLYVMDADASMEAACVDAHDRFVFVGAAEDLWRRR